MREKLIPGMIKTVFIFCYVAFMWASIHHLAAYFSNFEENPGSDVLGSYMLAGAFDLTALVATIGVMFFRKSMPAAIQALIWLFIVGIAAYSFVLNWEYAAHYQTASLVLQPTGDTTPVYDNHGNLQYVPVMRENPTLLFLNPILASGFTIFSLIYSIIAEFFGVKAPTVDELRKRRDYLKESADIKQEIQTLEGKGKGQGLISSLKGTALELKGVYEELVKPQEGQEKNTDKLPAVLPHKTPQETAPAPSQETPQETAPAPQEETPQETAPAPQEETPQETAPAPSQETPQETQEENSASWLAGSGTTVKLNTIVEHTGLSKQFLLGKIKKKELRATRGKVAVYKEELIPLLLGLGLLSQEETPQETAPGPQEETPQETAPAPQEETAPGPQEETAPAPQEETAPGPQEETAPGPQEETAPGPQEETAPAPSQEPQPQEEETPQETAPAPSAKKRISKPRKRKTASPAPSAPSSQEEPQRQEALIA